MEELFRPSQSTRCKTSLGLLPHSPMKGRPFATPAGGGGDVTAIVREEGSPSWASWSVLEGTFKNLNQEPSKDRGKRGGRWDGCWRLHQRTRELTAALGDRGPVAKSLKELTDKVDGLVEPGADVGFVIVLHGDALVEVRVLKMIGAVGGDVDESCDSQHVQHVLSGSMVRTSKVQKGQDFHWTTLRRRKQTDRHLAQERKVITDLSYLTFNDCTDLVI